MKYLTKIVVTDHDFFNNTEGIVIDRRGTNSEAQDADRLAFEYLIAFNSSNHTIWLNECYLKELGS